MSRAVVAIIALLFLSSVGIYGYQAALAGAGEAETITDEEWAPDAGNVTELDYSNLPDGYYYEDTVEVQSGQDNQVMTAGEDYEWINDNGTIYTVDGGGLDGQSTATVTYTYTQLTESQRGLAAIVSRVPQILGILAPLLGAALLLVILRG